MTVLRSAAFNVAFFILTFGATVTAAAVGLVAPHRVIGVARSWARLTLVCLRLFCGIRVKVLGREYLPQGPALIASRHQSAFDTLIWLILVPHCCYVLKNELLRIPLWGRLVKATGMIAIDRSGGATTLRALVQAGERAVRDQRQIIIFPEGTRSEPIHMLPLQPGIAGLAMRTGLPVIPAVTDSGLYWGRRAFRKRPGTIHVELRPPIAGGFRRKELMRRLEDALQTPVGSPIPAAETHPPVGNSVS